MDETVQSAAAEWLVRLNSRGVTLEDTLEWQRWIDADSRHKEAFARMEAVWDEPWELLGTPRSSNVWRAAAGVAALMLLAGTLAWHLTTSRSLATHRGETRSLALADGSRVTLGGDTRLEVDFDRRQRRLHLQQGEATFTVARDSARPFSVTAGPAQVTALGTEFNVRRNADHVTVAVVEGLVKVEPQQHVAWLSSPAPVRIEAGHETTVDQTGIKAPRKLNDPARQSDWQAGRLVFRGEPLRYVVEDVNRYSKKIIMLGDTSLGNLKFTGTVNAANVQGWVASLASAFSLRIEESTEKVVLRSTTAPTQGTPGSRILRP